MSAPRFLADEDLRLEIVLATKRIEPALEFLTVAGASRRPEPVERHASFVRG